MKTTARVSIVVLTYNRVAEVCRTLSKLHETCPAVPIIVVDNGSSDDTVETIRRRFEAVEVVAVPENLGAAGRNLGVARVTTDYVAFCDDDTWWEKHALAQAVPLMDRYPHVAALSAKVIVGDAEPASECHVDPTCNAMARSPLDATGLPGPALIGYMAGASIFRTRAFREVGGYAPRLFIGGEEELVALDLLARGWQLVYAPMLTLRHCPSPLRDVRRRRQLLARNAIWVACMRLPLRAIGRRAWTALQAMRRNHTLLEDGWDTLLGLRWALLHRRAIPSRVWTMLETVRLDDQQSAAPVSAFDETTLAKSSPERR